LNHWSRLRPPEPKAARSNRALPEVAESDENKPGVIRDFDKEGNLVSLEVLAVALRDVLDLEQQPLLFRGIG